MLKVLRKKGVSKKILWFVAIIIIISFGFFGSAYLIMNMKHFPSAGEIFGRKISHEDYEKAYRDVSLQALMHYGENFKQIKSFLNLGAEAWDRLILLHEADKRKITATNDEVVAAIQEYPFFQRDGMFNENLYQNIVKNVFKLTAREFEENIRTSIRFKKLYDLETANVQITGEEALNAFKEQNEKIQVSYAFIPSSDFKGTATYSDDQLKAYYEAHKPDYLLPPSINVQYMEFNYPAPDPNQSDQTSTDGQPETEKEAAINKAIEVYQQLQTNNDFKSVSAQSQTELKTTGFFTQDQPPLNLGWPFEFLNKIFATPLNTATEPFETSKGFIIAEVVEKKDSYVPSFDEALPKVKNALIESISLDAARQKAAELLPQIKEQYSKATVKDFSEIVKSFGLNVEQTPLFIRGQYLPKIGISKDFQDAAFALDEQNSLSGIVAVTKGFCILHLDSYTPPDQEQFLKEKDSIVEKLLAEKRSQAFQEFLNRLRLEANLTDRTNSDTNQ